ncbi:hypothetical protein KI688_012355 [Linnemannia hyalina]|uniref:Uncharacterized protein n=1 Tax=Linnemannia hyalina TaxID=64524 RepID=A0A9P8BTD9_9FUNG|nr:hypothetical protein KI688_012355 [Linnemannia hyalina]
MTHRTLSQTSATTTTIPRHQFQPRQLQQQQRQPYSTSTSASTSLASSTATSSSSTSPTATRRLLSNQQQQQQHLAVNDNTELDWKYLSAADTYTSEYSSIASDEFEEDGTAHNSAQVSDSSAGSRVATVQRSLGARPFLVPASTTPSTMATAGTLSSSLTTKEADDSTDTIKGMRARALDRVNGRKASSSNLSGSSGNLPGSNDYNPYRRSVTTTSSVVGSSDAITSSRNSSGQEATTAAGAGGTGSKIKRRSFGASDRSQSLRITTAGNTSDNSATKSDAQLNNPSAPSTLVRKRTSGPIKSQQQQQQQQQQPQQHALFTSEDDSEVPGQTVYQDRTRYASEGGMLVSEIKALKARVQELELERMNRSLSGLSVQSPQVMTPKSMDHSTTATSLSLANDSRQLQQQQSLTMSHSEKLQHIIQKHRGSSTSLDVANPLRSPVITAMSGVESARDVSAIRTAAAGGGGRLEPSLTITSPVRSPLLPFSTPRQPTTQHVDLLNIALKNYEKWTGAVSGATTDASSNPSFQAISRVATNAISMNQTIRAWVKADVSLVESSSMNALQRASDEQIRSLTEFLLAASRTSHLTAADRSGNNNNPTSDTESVNGGGSVISRPYSPRQSTVLHHRFGQGQRLSLGMVASELGAGGFEQNPPYPTRPLSTTAFETYEMLNARGAAGPGPVMVGNGMTSSGYLTRTSSIASSNISEPRARSTGPNVRHSQGGYASDYSYDRQPTSGYQGLDLSRNQLHQQQQQQQQQQQGGGALSSRENSPPQDEPRGPVPRRQASGLLMMDPQPTNMTPTRNLQSPQHPPLAAGGERARSNTPLDQQQSLTRRQVSVRNIMARYSQGAKSPNVSGFEHQSGDLQDSVIDQSQENGTGRPLSMTHQYDDGPRSPVFHPRQVVGQDQQQQQQQYRYRQQLQRQDAGMSASDGAFGPGHAQGQVQAQAQAQARMGGSIRRPLSQQDHRRNMAESRLNESAEGRHGSLGVRGGQRYLQERAGAFSEDENANASDWGSDSQRSSRGVVVVNPQRASMDSYSARLKQFRGRHEQQLPFHQEGLSFEEPYPDNGQQQQSGVAFSEGVVDVEAGDALSTGPVPRFAQRQHRYQSQTQSQYLDKPSQHRQQQHQHQHHQDMMMSTPSLPSPNSSPSSSARLDAPSLMMSMSNYGQGGGLVGAAGASSSSLSSLGGNGVDGRYHLSPRGPVGAATSPRQSVTGLNGDDHHQHGGLGGPYQGAAGRRMQMAALQTAL